MNKKYIVWLTDEEWAICNATKVIQGAVPWAPKLRSATLSEFGIAVRFGNGDRRGAASSRAAGPHPE